LRWAAYSAETSATEACAATGESRRCAKATTGITAKVATAKVAPAAKTAAAVRPCPGWQSKAYESDAYQAKKFNLFHNKNS